MAQRDVGAIGSFKPSLMSKNWGLLPETKRRLLLDLEERGGLLNCNLHQLCNDFPDVYGEPNTRSRKQIANQVCRWKRNTTKFLQERQELLFAPLESGEVLIPVVSKAKPVPTKHTQPKKRSLPATRLRFPFTRFEDSLEEITSKMAALGEHDILGKYLSLSLPAFPLKSV